MKYICFLFTFKGAQPGSQPNVHCSKDHSYTPLPMQVLPGSQQKMRSEVENMHLEDNSFSEITQMIVRGYPPDQADLGLKLHLSNLTGKNPECTNVYKEGQNVIATFSHPVGKVIETRYSDSISINHLEGLHNL